MANKKKIINERKQAEEQVHHSAHHDALTGLPNSILLNDRLRQATAKAMRDKGRMALMFIDLDEFKPVNDDLGRDVGDLLLKEAAKRMQACVHESVTVARVGGDEFIVLLPTIEAEQNAMVVAEKIRLALCQPYELGGHSLHISSSIGIAVYHEHGSNEETLSRTLASPCTASRKTGANVQLCQPGMK